MNNQEWYASLKSMTRADAWYEIATSKKTALIALAQSIGIETDGKSKDAIQSAIYSHLVRS